MSFIKNEVIAHFESFSGQIVVLDMPGCGAISIKDAGGSMTIKLGMSFTRLTCSDEQAQNSKMSKIQK
jgi:hypothetical protein